MSLYVGDTKISELNLITNSTSDEDISGANGIDITINTVSCKLYGEMLSAQGETFIYID